MAPKIALPATGKDRFAAARRAWYFAMRPRFPCQSAGSWFRMNQRFPKTYHRLWGRLENQVVYRNICGSAGPFRPVRLTGPTVSLPPRPLFYLIITQAMDG